MHIHCLPFDWIDPLRFASRETWTSTDSIQQDVCLVEGERMKLGIAQKFYLVLVLPLSIVSVIVIFMTYNGLKSNAADLEFALRLQAKGNNILSLIQGQDQASMGLLIDPSQLELFSQRKIDAYDSHKKLLAELKAEAISDKMLTDR